MFEDPHLLLWVAQHRLAEARSAAAWRARAEDAGARGGALARLARLASALVPAGRDGTRPAARVPAR
jgi:hypothetical protein